MYDIFITEQPNSIEELFAKPFAKLNQYPMDNEMSEIFMKLILLKDEDVVFREEEKPFHLKLMEKRLDVIFTCEVDIRTRIFISVISNSPAIVVMYLWYIQYICKTKNTRKMTFELFAEVFAYGFPSNEALLKMWESQKVDSVSDNLLDYPKAGESLLNF
jgi:hypothetical protein